MLPGLGTVIYKVSNPDKAKAWYSGVFGMAPYFNQPFYVGYNVGGYELCLEPDVKSVTVETNTVTYWGVADLRLPVTSLREKLNAKWPTLKAGFSLLNFLHIY